MPSLRTEGVRQTSLVGNLVLVSYLAYFPLFGSKRLDYFDWCQGVELVAKGNHQTTQALASMKDFQAGPRAPRPGAVGPYGGHEQQPYFYGFPFSKELRRREGYVETPRRLFRTLGPGVSQHAVQSAGKI